MKSMKLMLVCGWFSWARSMKGETGRPRMRSRSPWQKFSVWILSPQHLAMRHTLAGLEMSAEWSSTPSSWTISSRESSSGGAGAAAAAAAAAEEGEGETGAATAVEESPAAAAADACTGCCWCVRERTRSRAGGTASDDDDEEVPAAAAVAAAGAACGEASGCPQNPAARFASPTLSSLSNNASNRATIPKWWLISVASMHAITVLRSSIHSVLDSDDSSSGLVDCDCT